MNNFLQKMLTTLFEWHMLNKFSDTLLYTAFDSATKCIKKLIFLEI